MQPAISYPSSGHNACLLIEDESFWFRHRNECISALVQRFASGDRFADVGGGNGYVARRLQDDGLDVTLIEPGEDGARNARELRGIRKVRCSTLVDSAAGPFDAIGAFDVVEHIEDDRAFVDQVSDALTERGLFFVTVPAHRWLWSNTDREAGHFRRYTAETLKRLMYPHFDVLFASYFFAPLVPVLAMTRALPYRLGMQSASLEQSASRDHGTTNGAATTALSRLLRHEVQRITTLRPMSFGASLILAARKK